MAEPLPVSYMLSQPAAAVLHTAPVLLRRVPPDCAVLAFLGCCFIVCQLNRALEA